MDSRAVKARLVSRERTHLGLPVVLTVLVYVFCAGCLVIPVKVAPKTRAHAGLVRKETVDLSSIQTGVTTRQEVLERLGWTDVGLNDPRFFVGRWVDSSWWVGWMAVGYYQAGGGGNRVWHSHNVLVEFDDNGTVRGLSLFPNKDIVTIFASLTSRYPTPTLDFASPIELNVEHRRDSRRFRGKLILRSDSLEFVEDPELGGKGRHDFSTASENITRITASGESDTEHPELIPETIHFKRKTKVGRQMTIFTDSLSTMTLIKYLATPRKETQ